MPTTESTVATDRVTVHAITAGVRELEHYITDHPGFGSSMNVEGGPRVAIRLNDETEVNAFADHFQVVVSKAPVDGGWYMVATAHLEGLAVAAWARTDSAVTS
ncbi:hypothetical protein [Microbacterium enclense]|uniref:hypothetical protein n=1 Tax=Microbacterium enclense TaxID=993073 RepID=UPI00343C2D2A